MRKTTAQYRSPLAQPLAAHCIVLVLVKCSSEKSHKSRCKNHTFLSLSFPLPVDGAVWEALSIHSFESLDDRGVDVKRMKTTAFQVERLRIFSDSSAGPYSFGILTVATTVRLPPFLQRPNMRASSRKKRKELLRLKPTSCIVFIECIYTGL
jgi:hypothetical protein